MKRRLATLALAALGTIGCGGRPPAPAGPEAGALVWTAHHGGAWVATCPTDDGFIGLRAGALDRWLLPAEGPPRSLPALPLPWPGADGPGVALDCARGVVHRAGGSPLGIDDDSLVQSDGGPAPSPVAAASATVGGRAIRLDRGGWSLLERGEVITGRATAGDFADATWDGHGRVLWAVGPTGLWRWSPDRAYFSPIALPGGARRALMRVWRDGPFLWVVDDSRIGYALDLSTGLARLARDPGPVRLTGPERLALVGGRRVAVTLGASEMAIDDDPPVAVSGRITAFAPLGEAEVLVGVGDAIERWRVAGEARRVDRWVTGDPTRRIIVSGGRVLAVGGYGLLVGAVELPEPPLSPPPFGVAPAADPSARPFPAAAPPPAAR